MSSHVYPQPAKLLIVDDDKELQQLLHQYLVNEGFEVMTASNGQEMDMIIQQKQCDLMILDQMMPGEDGLSILRRLSATASFPVIMLSAKGQDLDRIIGLEVGADDYIAKPFNPRELLARIRVILRRHNPVKQNNHFKFGDFILDVETRSLFRGEETIAITDNEFHLLYLFIQHPNQLLSRDQIMESLHGYEHMPFDGSFDIRITRLRKKIEPDPATPVFIRTVWGKGYQFTPGCSVI